jgi:predicted nuclease of predicted toxin-antitoxin system
MAELRRLLADENFPGPAIRGLREAGHDVLAVREYNPGINDLQVLELARQTGRWLLTFDSDFGNLVYACGAEPPPAILYFRLMPIHIEVVLALAKRAVLEASAGSFAVISPEATRLRPFPSPSA